MIGALLSCQRDQFTHDPSAQLTFTVDTLSFDTLFQAIPSTTKSFWIKNNNANKISTTIRLEQGSASAFRLNVDGFPLQETSTCEIRGGDSICVFVAVTAKPNDPTTPPILYDKILCQTNGSQQEVVLTVYARRAKMFRARFIMQDTTLTSDLPILIYDSLMVGSNATLRITEGTELFFHDKAYLGISGTIIAEGSYDHPIVFRGDRLDKILPDLSYDQMSGQWGGILLTGSSYHNIFNHVRIRGGSYGLFADISSNLFSRKALLTNTIITNVVGSAITSVSNWIEAENCEFSNAGQSSLLLIGGRYRFNHCTIANYYKWQSRGQTPTLYMSNHLPTAQGYYPFPMVSAYFTNCIVYGSNNDELGVVSSINNQPIEAQFDYSFENCLLKTKSRNLPNFKEIQWDEDPKFKAIGEKYQFDYRLDSTSVAIRRANPAYRPASGRDLLGHPISTITAPDLGCYQWMPYDYKP